MNRARPTRQALGLATVGLLLAGCTPPKTDPHVRLIAGEEAYHRKDFAVAAQHLTAYLADSEDEAARMRAYYVRGMALAQTGARGRAYEDLERTAGGAQDPVLAGNAHAVLGVLHFEDGHWIQAQRAFRAAIDRLPPRPPCDALLYRRGLCQERSGRWAEALMSYEHVVHDYPAGPYAGNAQRRLQLQADHFAVQCGVFAEQANANRLVADLAERGLSTYVRGENRGGQQYFIVLNGRFTAYEDAIDALAQAKGYVPGAVLWP